MGNSFGRWARALLLVGVIALAATGFMSVPGASPNATSVAFAGPALDDNNDDPTGDDNNAERELQGQVIDFYPDLSPPEILVATTHESVWARLYNEQLERSGVRMGDHVRLQGEYNKGVFDAYEVDVQDRCCPGPNNANDNS
jgi:hypothetical protein